MKTSIIVNLGSQNIQVTRGKTTLNFPLDDRFKKIKGDRKAIKNLLRQLHGPSVPITFEGNRTAEEILHFIQEKPITIRPNELISFYEGPQGLAFTRGSNEIWKASYNKILNLIFFEEIPKDKEELLKLIDFKILTQNQ